MGDPAGFLILRGMETRTKRHNFSLPEKRRMPAIVGAASLLICLNLMLASCWVIFNDDPTGQSEAVSWPTPKRSVAATRMPRATSTPTARPTPTRTPTPTVTPSPTPAVTAAQLEAVALTVADLSSDWETSDAVDLGADREDSICNAPGPDTVMSLLPAPRRSTSSLISGHSCWRTSPPMARRPTRAG